MQVNRKVLGWMNGLLDSGWGGRDVIEHLMFPELTRVDNEALFELLVMRNQDDIEQGKMWRLVQIHGPHEGKYYFEIQLHDTNGDVVPGSSRVGYFDVEASYPNDVFSAGASFYIDNKQLSSCDAEDLFVMNADGVMTIDPPAATTLVVHGIVGFWAAYPIT
jgi:hypothetical protein